MSSVFNTVIRTCHVCLSNDRRQEYVQISADIRRLFHFCCGFEIPKTCIQHMICNKCLHGLTNFSDFKKKCYNSHQFWDRIFNNKVICRKVVTDIVKKEEVESHVEDNVFDVIYQKPKEVEEDWKSVEFEEDWKPEELKEECMLEVTSQCDGDDADMGSECPSVTTPCENTQPSKCDGANFNSSSELTLRLAKSPSKKKLSTKSFCCPRCNKEYSCKTRFLKHVKNCKATHPKVAKVPDEDIQECGLCGARAAGRAAVAEHLTRHLNDNDLQCRLCGFDGADFAEMLVHRAEHTRDGQLVCACGWRAGGGGGDGARLAGALGLRYHWQRQHGAGARCEPCGLELPTSRVWARHHRRVHGPRLQCDHCGMKMQRTALVEHLQAHEGRRSLVCSVCGRTFSRRRYLQTHEAAHTAARAQCGECGRWLRSAAGLRRHAAAAHGPRPLACAHCPRTFATRRQLAVHAVAHSAARAHRCAACPAAFKRRSALAAHARSVHGRARPHRCELCPAAFERAGLLRRHAAAHGARRAHACPRCARTFHSPSLLRRHVLRRHPELARVSTAPPAADDDAHTLEKDTADASEIKH